MVNNILTIIRNKRLQKNYSQKYLASKLQISQSYYAKIENGNKKLTVEELIEIAETLDLEIPNLFIQNTKLKSV